MLQASIHARGARPYAFAGRADEWHAPGAVFKNGVTRCAVDAAWLMAPVLGAPRAVPPMWPGVPGARERAFQYGAGWRTPDGKQAREYQMEGAAFLAERDYGILTDQMGIGKTMEAIIAAEARLSLGVVPTLDTPVVLVFCPAIAKRMWQREIKRWAGFDAAILEGLRPSELPRARYVIANYDILFGQKRRDALGVVHAVQGLTGWGSTLAGRFLIAVADEAHNLRGRRSERRLAVRAVCRGVTAVWGLTGTPMPNYVRDLWGLADTVSDGLFGDYYPWVKAYCDGHQGTYGFDDRGKSRADELSKRLSLFMFGRDKDAVGLELPPMQREVYKVDVTVSAPTVHEGHKALDKTSAVANAFRATANAKRSVVVTQAIEALENKQKVVVALYMRQHCDSVAKGVKDKIDVPVMCVHGDMSPEGRDKMAQTFRDTEGPAAFVCTIDAVGIAISLVGADLLLVGDLVPEPWKLLQLEKRAHRFDSKKSLLVRYLIATGTIDEGLAETVVEKLSALEATMGVQTETTNMTTALMGRTTTEIIDDLFARLKAGGS